MASEQITFTPLTEAIEKFKTGSFVVVMDDESRENEGDLIMAAEFATPEAVTLCIRNTSGILCAPMTAKLAQKLALPLMVDRNSDPNRTAFTITIDHAQCTTGVSAADRSLTFKSLVEPNVSAEHYRRPGHIFPLIARDGGVLERRGHTEVSIDLCKLAGLKPVGLLAELMNADGTMSRLPECAAFAKEHNLPLITVEQVAQFRAQTEQQSVPRTPAIKTPTVTVAAECTLPIQRIGKFLGTFDAKAFYSSIDGQTHVTLSMGDIKNADATNPLLVRVHSECFTGNTLGSMRCDCHEQLDLALEKIAQKGRGLVVYVGGHEGRGIGLINKIKAYALQETEHLDTFTANQRLGFQKDQRSYDSIVAIFEHFGIQRVSLMTNNKHKYHALDRFVADVSPVVVQANNYNKKYLEDKHKEQAHVQQEFANNNKAAARVGAYDVAAIANEVAVKKEIPISLPTPTNLHKLRVSIIRTAWNENLVNSLADQTKQRLIDAGVKEDNILESMVPGSFELPWAAQQVIDSAHPDVVICFGVLIKGETAHFEYISGSVSQGLMDLQMSSKVPILYGVLNCFNLEQADARCNSTSQLPLSLSATAIHMGSLKRGFLPLMKGDSFVGEPRSLMTPQPCGN